MKNKIFPIVLIFFTLVSFTTKAQIPNASFENWTSGTPDGWWTNNQSALNLIEVTQTNDAESGTSAAKCQVVSFAGMASPPILGTGTYGSTGFSVNKKYASLKGYYKFQPVGGDILAIAISMIKNGSVIGIADVNFQDAKSSYTQFNVNINYGVDETPDTCVIVFTISPSLSNDSLHVGSTLFVDKLSLSTVTAVNENKKVPFNYSLYQNYPNPFNPTTTIRYQLPKPGFVTLKIYDVLGKNVKTLVSKEQQSGMYRVMFDASKLASGVYYFRLHVNHFTKVKKMLVLK